MGGGGLSCWPPSVRVSDSPGVLKLQAKQLQLGWKEQTPRPGLAWPGQVCLPPSCLAPEWGDSVTSRPQAKSPQLKGVRGGCYLLVHTFGV